MDFLLGENNDWVIENGDVVLTSGASLTRQRWLQKVRTYKTEWVLDIDYGTDYFNDVFTKPNLPRIEAIFRKLTLDTPGVLLVSSCSAVWVDKANRLVEVTVEGQVEGPEDFVFSFKGFVAADPLQCSASFPNNFSGLVVWFDGQDYSNSNYDGVSTNATNKAAPGQAAGTCSMLGVSDFSNKRAFVFDRSNTETLDVVDTPAIRRSTGDFTMFATFKNVGTADGNYGIVSFLGITATGDPERFMIYINVSAGVPTLKIASKRNGSASEIATANFIDYTTEVVLSLRFEEDYLYVYSNGLPLSFDVPNVSPREFNGDYIIGALVDDASVNSAFFDGLLGDFLVYNRALDTGEINSITFCLGQKWGTSISGAEVAVGYGFFPYTLSAYGL